MLLHFSGILTGMELTKTNCRLVRSFLSNFFCLTEQKVNDIQMQKKFLSLQRKKNLKLLKKLPKYHHTE
ncbi:hypothetical protein BS78_03G087200 [Paspalum vaginatum]|nr:hypothetical protein BS78_03G087200 [Paspalum vaginatum]